MSDPPKIGAPKGGAIERVIVPAKPVQAAERSDSDPLAEG